MSDWIDLQALWQIVVFGLLAGAGLPAVFALGLRALAIGKPSGESEQIVGGNPIGMVLGGICFLIVLAGIAGGIYFIVAAS